MAIKPDFTRPATVKERVKLERRLQRFQQDAFSKLVLKAGESLSHRLPAEGLEIRKGFSYLKDPPEQEASDRHAPLRENRPPATRITASRGGTLRFMLALLTLAQSGRRRGELANLRDLNFSVSGSFNEAGWADVLVTDAVDSKTPETHLTARNKRARSVRSALRSLDEAGLIEIPVGKKKAPLYDQFVLLNECGFDALGEIVYYKKPAKQEPTFFLPAGLIDNGWVHVLEDMELALLMMICCREGGFIKNGFAIPAETRLLNYGIHRDAFSAARKTLEWLGLIDVNEMDRNADGTAQEKIMSLHRLELLKSGFDRPALPTALETFERQIDRSQVLG